MAEKLWMLSRYLTPLAPPLEYKAPYPAAHYRI